MDPSKRPSLLWGALVIAVFCGLTAAAGYEFVRWRVIKAIEQQLEEGARQIEAALAVDRAMDLEAYNRTFRDIRDYAVVLSDGTVLDIGSGTRGIVHGIFPPVRIAIPYQQAIDRPAPLMVNAAGTSERWTFLARRLDHGIAILGISGLDPDVRDPGRVLERNMARVGRTVAGFRHFDGAALDNGVHWAVVDDGGELVAAHGRVPLTTDPMALAARPLGTHEVTFEGAPYLVMRTQLHDKAGRAIGRIVLPRTFAVQERAMRDQLEFSLALAAVSFVVFLLLLLRYTSRAEREKRRLREAFRPYLSAKVLDLALADPGRLPLGGERREIAVLFSDIRSFTEIAERLAPRRLTAMLQEYFEAMTDEVYREDGVLDKFIGDGVMAFWGAPVEQPDHADRALRTAQAMLRRLEGLHRRWSAAGLPAFDIGIGINVGVVTVGNMGSSRRFEYTAIGDAVNVAARLEELNKAHGSRIIVSESMRGQVTIPVRVRDLGEVRLHGRQGEIRAFEVLMDEDAAEVVRAAPRADVPA
jgi:class 3 adenylate cyclase